MLVVVVDLVNCLDKLQSVKLVGPLNFPAISEGTSNGEVRSGPPIFTFLGKFRIDFLGGGPKSIAKSHTCATLKIKGHVHVDILVVMGLFGERSINEAGAQISY